jgi:CBS-domain-containing membrane protein
MHLIDKSFRKAPKNYIRQSLLAALVVGIILFVFRYLSGDMIIVAALGASTFIVFAMPDTVPAQPRRLIGGHAVGLLAGTVSHLIFFNYGIGQVGLTFEAVYIAAGALAVGLAIFLMTITNTEHPPAATTALGIIISGLSYKEALFVMLTAVCLAVARRLLRRHLKNLF